MGPKRLNDNDQSRNDETPRPAARHGITRKPEKDIVRMIRLASIPVLQAIYAVRVERLGKDSFKARFYLRYADSWYPKTWTKEQLEEELGATEYGLESENAASLRF